ncbi:hypothetical protein L2E82_06053 [Cichorium intybus]|uniref:Uncharacterized protein n=1 Tax=Cichorium intybus TaxID=13427 RepID=A0ACB9H9F8_CICIN|nr:hypothetical protein L2E82_06053 [Cichorium intybus]
MCAPQLARQTEEEIEKALPAINDDVEDNGPNEIPDINDPMAHSDCSFGCKNKNKISNKKSVSVKFKDIIRASNQLSRKSRKLKKPQDCNFDEVSSSKASLSSATGLGSSSEEIAKTIDVGRMLGYKLQGAERCGSKNY